MPDQLLDTTNATGTDIAGQDHGHTFMDIEVTVAIIHSKVIPDCIKDVIRGALYDTITPALIAIAMTNHTRDHPHVEVYQPFLEIVADPDHAHCIKQVKTPCLNSHPVPVGQQ